MRMRWTFGLLGLICGCYGAGTGGLPGGGDLGPGNGNPDPSTGLGGSGSSDPGGPGTAGSANPTGGAGQGGSATGSSGAGGSPGTSGGGTAGSSGTGTAGAAGTSGGGGASGTGSGGSSGTTTVCTTSTSPLLTQVLQVVQRDGCQACHGATPIAGAPMPLVTYDNLVAPAKTNAAVKVVQMMVTRMSSTTAPMPPGRTTAPPTADIQILQNWIAAGTPQNVQTCTTVPTGSGGSGGSAGMGGAGGTGGSTGTGGTTGTGGATGSGGATGTGGTTTTGTGGTRGTGGATGTGGTTTGTGAGGTTGTGGTTTTGAGLFCAAQAVIQARCSSTCHSATPNSGAPMAMVTFANLTARSPSRQDLTVGAYAVMRMRGTPSIMPPAPASPVPAADITAVSNWVNAGLPNDCTGGGTG